MSNSQFNIPRHWWGKILGGTLGLFKGGISGALIGVLFGHIIDRFIAGFIGWFTNWLAVKATLYPVEFVGIPPAFGWQGVIPKNTADLSKNQAQTNTTFRNFTVLLFVCF